MSNSNQINFGPLVSMPQVNSNLVDFHPLAPADTTYSNSVAVTLNGSPVTGAKILVFEQATGGVLGESLASSYVIALTETNASGMWSINVEAFVNFNNEGRYAFYVWYTDIATGHSYSAPVQIAITGGAVTVNHDPLEYQEPVTSDRVWFNPPALPEGFEYIEVREKSGGVLQEAKPYQKDREGLKRTYVARRKSNPDQVLSVTINQSTVLITTGETAQLTATVQTVGNPSSDLTWFSADTAVATVSSTGLVTGVADGVVGITARSVFDTNKSDDVNVTVAATVSTLDSQAGDQIALQDLYNDTAGIGWANSTGWSSSIDLSTTTPFGVTKQEVSAGVWRVIEINLPTNNLTGVLPESLGNLKRCKQFYVKANFLTGQLPANIGLMTDLEYLYLAGAIGLPSKTPTADYHPGKSNPETNTFAGSVLPAEWGQLANIKHIEISQTGCVGSYPPEWGQMSTLERLYLNGTRVEAGAPGGYFTGTLPPEWSGMTSLTNLNLSNNPNLTGTHPGSWASMPMVNLRLGIDNVTGTIPPEWEAWGPTLRIFLIRSPRTPNGRLTGQIPAWLLDDRTPLMHTLHLDWNNFTSIEPVDSAAVTKIVPQVVALDFNNFSEPWPNYMKRWYRLQIISFAGFTNQLSGPIDDDFFVGWYQLRNTRWGGLNIGGPLPSSFGNSRSSASTQRLEFNSSGFTGSIPATWANYRSNGVNYVYLNGNSLSGPIPAGIADWRSVTAPTVTVTSSTNTINHASNAYANGDIIYFESTGTLPGGLTADTKYYVINRTTSTYRVSLTLGGDPVSISTDGTPTITVRKNAWRTTANSGTGLNISNNNFSAGDKAALIAAWPPNVPLTH